MPANDSVTEPRASTADDTQPQVESEANVSPQDFEIQEAMADPITFAALNDPDTLYLHRDPRSSNYFTATPLLGKNLLVSEGATLMIAAAALGPLPSLRDRFYLHAESRSSTLSPPSVPPVLTMQSTPFNSQTVQRQYSLPARISTFAYSSANLVCAHCS